MQPIFFIVLIGLVGGMAIGLQSPMASMLSQRMGVWESIFIVHAGGAAAALIPLLVLAAGSAIGEASPGMRWEREHSAWSSSLR